MKRAFTMIELIMVIVIIGILASMAMPKLNGFSGEAKKSAEIATASALSAALDRIEGEWSISDGDFDWDNDHITDDIKTELSAYGYPYHLNKNNKTFGAVLKSTTGGKFLLQQSNKKRSQSICSIFTGPASNPLNGVSSEKEIRGKPDKNDFWLYVIEANATNNGCFVKGDNIDTKQIISGDFILIDVKGDKKPDFKRDDLGISFDIVCN